ncbi:MAG TPA: hypothetical protein VK195_14495 [Burkholderiaceae bacterium]|nr:hypothetical protein [Burkholderiaceae bacterium]
MRLTPPSQRFATGEPEPVIARFLPGQRFDLQATVLPDDGASYRLADDGYPQATDIDHRLLVGYGANADRFEDWRTKATPLKDTQQHFAKDAPLK